MSYINKILGSDAELDFYIGGIARIALIEKKNVTVTKTADNVVTAITLDGTSKFQEIFFEKGSASYEGPLSTTGGRFIDQKLTFKVSTDDLATVKAVILGRYQTALIMTKGGKWRLIGDTIGLETKEYSEVLSDDEGLMSFVMGNPNKGLASNVVLATGNVDDLINSVA